MFSACSTPFGITGCYAVPELPVKQIEKCVLNAFRHHRMLRFLDFLHLLGIRTVLNAFRHHRMLRAATGFEDFCVLSCSVLNAFRHHRMLRSGLCPGGPGYRTDMCSTPFGITGCYAKKETRARQTARMCSTPFGITGCYAADHSENHKCSIGAQRLSASQDATHNFICL